jgi:hypothetical protein
MTMKILTQQDCGASTRGWSIVRLAARKAVLLTTLATLALVGPSAARSGGGNGGGPGVSGGGDETLGTLPIVGGIHIDLPCVRGWRGDHPAFYIEGTAAQLGLVIHGARGTGFVGVEVLDPRTSRLRLTFHGDVTLVLDRELVGVLSLPTGLAVPREFGPVEATFGWGTNPLRTVRLRPGVLPLPVASLSADRVLDQGPLQFRALGRNGAHSSDTVFVTPETVVLRQTY